MRRQHLVIMVKAPEAGRVKTRLAAAIGAVEAVRCYRAMLAHTMRRVADRRWATWLAVTPDGAAPRMAAHGIAAMPQGPGGLGTRMQRVMDELPPGPVVIVGSDIPGIGRGDVAAAFRALGGHDAVFGPADDGGYWLVGQRRIPRVLRLFENVRWSSAETLGDTMENLEGRTVALLRTLGDLDGEADYLRWRRGRNS
ncbi:MAG TPA: TIGR04282 family arsenosugar biosynthesis glycosyltransferase [Aestuariivirgaceae bacterium]|nr:TIGR04282 family arsenosugar biosynthesis glycosyltransferase [Aestuariivirgaceae bacterium]